MKKFLFIISVLSFLLNVELFANDLLNKGNQIFNTLKSNQSGSTSLSNADIGDGLKEALNVATDTVVGKLGSLNGFYSDSKIHIPLPNTLMKVKKTLDKIGFAKSLNDLETKLNRAAEIATPKAKEIFFKAISEMTIEDVKKIYNGEDDAATKYFKNKMTPDLSKAMKPLIDQSLSEVEAVQVYNSIIDRYNSTPLVTHLNGDISDYALTKTLDGIFYYLAKEEAEIRKNPAKRTTELLKKVFGSSR